MIRGLLMAVLAALPIGSALVVRRGAARLLAAPRRMPGEDALGPAIDALGGEVVRLRARDGVRLAARWLVAEPGPHAAQEPGEAAWHPDPHEAILLMHGYSGSIAPDLVEYVPWLRRTASVLGLDFRGHGDSADGPTTFGLLEVEDVAGALAWLGERGVTRVALVGTSMGAATALAAVTVLGDGRLRGPDVDPAAPRAVDVAPRPTIVAVVADSVAPEHAIPVGRRLPGPFGRFIAQRLFDAASRQLPGDPRATEPIRVIGLVEDVPLLLIHGEADRTVPLADARRLAAAAPPATRHLVIAGADHSGGHAADPMAYELAVTTFLRGVLSGSRVSGPADPVLSGHAPPGVEAP